MSNSIYEGTESFSPLHRSGIALGRISAVDPTKRFCSVKTFFGDPWLIDKNLPKVQWLSVDANPEGDESTSIPRVGATGLVFFVGSIAFIWGYFKATDPKKGAVTGKEQTDLNEGDKVFSTVGGNRISIKANGSVEIFSKETLKTIFFPKDGLLADICEAYQLKADGGNISWRTINDLNETLYRQEFRKDLARTTVIVEKKGSVDSTAVRKISIGSMLPGSEDVTVPVYEETTDITGKINTKVGVLGLGVETEMTPTGGWFLKNSLSGIKLSDSGDWSITTPIGLIEMLASGDIKLSNAVGQATISAQGDIELSNAIGLAKIGADGTVDLGNAMSKLLIDPAGLIGIGGAAELLDLFDKLLDAFINLASLTMTGTGPSGPLDPSALAKLIEIKTNLALIKGSI